MQQAADAQSVARALASTRIFSFVGSRPAPLRTKIRVSSQNLLSQFFVPDVFVFRTGGLVALGSSRGRRVGEAARLLSLSSLSHSALSTEAT